MSDTLDERNETPGDVEDLEDDVTPPVRTDSSANKPTRFARHSEPPTGHQLDQPSRH